jgi:uncharacterized membrane protein
MNENETHASGAREGGGAAEKQTVPPSQPLSAAGGKTATGIDSNLCAALAYVGWAMTGVLFFVLEPEDRFVRFHALQSILLTAALIVVAIGLGVVPFIGPFLFGLASVGFVLVWLLAMWKALHHVQYLLPFIGEIARAQVERPR